MSRSLTETPKNKTDSSSTLINRTALDSFGNIGFFYDGYRDQVLDPLNVTHRENSSLLHQIRRCEILSGKKGDNPDIFQMVSIDDESRLSVLLNLRENKGVAAVNDYTNPINECTRVFCYTYVERVQNQSNIAKDIQKISTRLRSNKPATHIITKVEWGIDVAVVLQLPSIHDSIIEIDRVLRQICNLFQSDYDTSPLQLDEKNILKKVIHTRVFSNTNEVSRLSTLYDVCTYIQQNKNSTAKCPVSYGLQRITWLYPQYYGQEAPFVPLIADLNQRLQQYLLQITSNKKKSMAFATDYLPKCLSGHLQKELSRVQKQCSDVSDKYVHEVDRFSKLVVGVRNGQIKMSRIDDALKDEEQLTMKKTISEFNQVLTDLANKGHFISDLERQHFRYVDITDYDLDGTDNGRTIESQLITNPAYERILCSNDLLNKNDPDQLHQLQHNLVEERRNNPELRLIYADFSSCCHQLPHMMRLPLSIYNTENNGLKQKHPVMSPIKTHSSYASSAETQTPVAASEKALINDTTVTNIQRYASLPTESKKAFPPVKEDERPSPSKNEPQSYGSPQTQLSTPSLLSAEVHNTNTTANKTQKNVLLLAQSKPSFPVVKQNRSPVPPVQVSTTAPIDVLLSTETPTPRSISPSSISMPLLDNGVINILLLGETGVGKSTFINAFANYLTFDTLPQAEKSQAVVLIPVSFLITVGDNFDEHIVKFGNVADGNNEDFEHPGHSVTQHCRSYTFNLNGDHGKKLRIIDTPGFGDTRGIDQDDYNMAHILEYIRKLSHLNAVCFLLKPNESRLNIFFRSCLTQLFSLLGPNIAENILFCFTNSRSTFYTPGNTAPLLRKMLTSLSKVNVPFKKDNTFCFDSESFRYLVSLQNQIPFSDRDKEDYEMSWAKSVTEANRLVQYILVRT